MADCFEGSIFETEPAGLNRPIMVPPSSLSLCSANMRHFRRLISDCRWLFCTHSTWNTLFSRLVFYSARFFHNPVVYRRLVEGTAPRSNSRISDKQSPVRHGGNKSNRFNWDLHFLNHHRLLEACAKDTKLLPHKKRLKREHGLYRPNRAVPKDVGQILQSSLFLLVKLVLSHKFHPASWCDLLAGLEMCSHTDARSERLLA